MAGAAVAATGASALLQSKASKDQYRAMMKANEDQQLMAENAQANATSMGGVGATGIRQLGDKAGQTLADFGAQGIGELQQGRDMALGQLLGYGQEASGSLTAGFGDAIGTLQGVDQGSRVNQLLNDPSGYMAQDPGYQFRQQQGEQAINRMNAAQGGRFSGRAAKELGQFNQGLASQEFGAAYQRAAGADQAAFARGSGIAGLQAGQGSAMAGHQTGMGDRLSNLFTGTGSQLASAYGGLGANLANQYNTIASGQANALQGASTQNTALTQSVIPGMTQAAGFAGGQYNAAAQGVANLGGLAAAYAGSQPAKPQPFPETYTAPDQPGMTSGTTGTGYT